jgi:quinol-cytochrome oxidoreductase complex cytochrome b subunit
MEEVHSMPQPTLGSPPALLGAVVDLNRPDTYFHWGFLLISMANLLVIAGMVALFILALFLPFIHSKAKHAAEAEASAAPDVAAVHPDHGASRSVDSDEPSSGLWTQAVRRRWLKLLPPEKILPDSQPAYVSSWVYVFGVLTISGLAVAILSGLVLALRGPTWWHTSIVGHFVNSLHLWSVELFMAFMALHLWGKFWMAAWRGKRALTWITGMLCFLIAVVEAFTGYLSQSNFDSQWIAFEAKDAFNASGAGAFFNAMNFGQALMLHIVFVPLVLVLLVGIHILLVRMRGVSHPIDADPADVGPIEADWPSTEPSGPVGVPSSEGHLAGDEAGVPAGVGAEGRLGEAEVR